MSAAGRAARISCLPTFANRSVYQPCTEMWSVVHQFGIHALVAAPNGRLVSGSGDATIRIWGTESLTEEGLLSGHELAVTALAILPSGRLVSASVDKTIRAWAIGPTPDQHRELARIEIDAAAYCLTSLQDGRVVAGDSLGRLHRLNIIE